VPDPSSIIKACSALVKADGQLFFSTLNRNAKSYLFAIIGAEYILKLVSCPFVHFARFDELVPVMSALWQEFEDVFCTNNGK
jgi:2-polyprenyl-6-hydroxyphenyl methylase/3-demethylubiquinone-9 3-methyltransferase